MAEKGEVRVHPAKVCWNRQYLKSKRCMLLLAAALTIICLARVLSESGVIRGNLLQPDLPLSGSDEDIQTYDVPTEVKSNDSPTSPIYTDSPEAIEQLEQARPDPFQHVFYLKTHKTGSSTAYSIMAQYTRRHGLLPLLPKGEHINQRPPLNPKNQLMLLQNADKYDTVFNHQVFDKTIFKYLHNDTFRFTTLREPFSHFVSSFTYFRRMENQAYLKKMSEYKDPLSTFLSDPQKYEAQGYSSYTNNRQSVDLGYDINTHSFTDDKYIAEFIQDTERQFNLVLIMEYFLESAVLLKRTLHWKTEDILFYKKNSFDETQQVLQNTTLKHRQQHQAFSKPDIELYNHFLAIFKQKVYECPGMIEEVEELKVTLEKVRGFCDQAKTKQNSLKIPAGRWSDSVSLRLEDCQWLKMKELDFTRYLQYRAKHCWPTGDINCPKAKGYFSTDQHKQLSKTKFG